MYNDADWLLFVDCSCTPINNILFMRSTHQVQKQVVTHQTSSHFTSELDAERELFLRYANSSDKVVLSGSNDYGIISALKNSLVSLKSDYFSSSGNITIESDRKIELDRRFILLENEIDGLLRRRI